MKQKFFTLLLVSLSLSFIFKLDKTNVVIAAEKTNTDIKTSSDIIIPKQYEMFEKSLAQSRAFSELNMEVRPIGMGLVEGYFNKWQPANVPAGNNIGLVTMERNSQANFMSYRTSTGIYGRYNYSVQKRTLQNTMDLNKDFMFNFGLSNVRTDGPPIASSWTLFNGAMDTSNSLVGSMSDAMSSMSIGNIPNSYSFVQVVPGSTPNPNLYQVPSEASDPLETRYSQVVTSDAYGKLKRVGNPVSIPYSGYYENNWLEGRSTGVVFKYTAHNRKLELYMRNWLSATNYTEAFLQEFIIPSSWSTAGIQWANTFAGSDSKNLQYSTMGWIKNSGYQNLSIPVIYRDAATGQEIYTSYYKDWKLYENTTLTNQQAMDLANDYIRKNYTVRSISSQVIDVYNDVLGGNEEAYSLSKKPIYVDLNKAPTTKNVIFNAYSVNEDIPLANHETGFGDVIFQNRTLTIPYAQQTVNMGTLSEINAFKNKLTSDGYDITKIRTFQSNGTVVDFTTDTAIPAETSRGYQNVIYFYKAKESTIKVQFVDETGATLAPDISINAKVPDKTIDLTKNQSVQNTLSNLENSNYSIITRPNNETALPVDTSKTVKYVLKKNERSTVVDPSDGTTPFVPKDSNGNDANQNPTTEDLRIQYVSDFDFGKHSQSMDEVNTLAAADKGIRENESTAKDVVSFISVIDDRAVQSNWTLNVSASPFRNNAGQTLSGATIQLSGLNYKSPASDKPVAETGIKDISSGTTRISYANKKLSLKSWSLSFGELTNNKESSGAKLIVPANTPKDVGQYQSTINWNLVTGTP